MLPRSASRRLGTLLPRRSFGPGGAFDRFLKMFSGMAVRLVVQMGYFVLLARFLGPSAYGMFVAASSTSVILSTLGGLGAEVMLPKWVSRGDMDLRTGLRCALGNVLVGTPPLLLVAVVLTATVASPGLPFGAVLAVCLSDTVLFRISNVAANAHLSLDRIFRTMLVLVGVNVARLLAILGATAWLPAGSLLTWSLLYAGATGLAALVSIVPLWRELGSLTPIVRGDWLREGFSFGLSTAAQVAYGEVDKPLIGRLISSEAAGLYAAATRITDAALMPILSIIGIMVTRFFKHGKHGARSSLALAKRVLPAVIGFGLLTPIGLVLGAPYLPLLLGHRYAAAEPILLWLSVMPLITGCYFIAGDVLTSTGKQLLRSVIQAAGVLIKIPISVMLAMRFGLVGCIWAILLSSVLLLAITTAMVFMQAARDPAPLPAAAE